MCVFSPQQLSGIMSTAKAGNSFVNGAALCGRAKEMKRSKSPGLRNKLDVIVCALNPYGSEGMFQRILQVQDTINWFGEPADFK